MAVEETIFGTILLDSSVVGGKSGTYQIFYPETTSNQIKDDIVTGIKVGNDTAYRTREVAITAADLGLDNLDSTYAKKSETPVEVIITGSINNKKIQLVNNTNKALNSGIRISDLKDELNITSNTQIIIGGSSTATRDGSASNNVFMNVMNDSEISSSIKLQGENISITSDSNKQVTFSVPPASATTSGVVKIGDNISVNNGVISVSDSTIKKIVENNVSTLDTRVKQVSSSNNSKYPLLASNKTTTTITNSTLNSAIYDTNIYIIPSEGSITAKKIVGDTITSNNFIGNLSGTATKAVQDENGNSILNTYAFINSPEFKGVPTAPNAKSAVSVNYTDQQIANLAYVNRTAKDNNTHYRTSLYVTDSTISTSNSKTEDPFIIINEHGNTSINDESEYSSSQWLQLVGDGIITVSSNANKKIIISAEDTNTDENIRAAVVTNDEKYNHNYPLLMSNNMNESVPNGASYVQDEALLTKQIFANPVTRTITANNFIGDLQGTATKAIQDENGNDIISTYAKKENVITDISFNDASNKLTYVKGNNSYNFTITDEDTKSTVLQEISDEDATYPILANPVMNQTLDTVNSAIFSKDIKINPARVEIQASAFTGSTFTGTTFTGTNKTSATFIGDLKGNATSATKATQDGSGNNIISTYAPINSPGLKGTPMAPTADIKTNNQQVATTEFVHNIKNQLIGTKVDGTYPENTILNLQNQIDKKQNQHSALTSISNLNTAKDMMIYTTGANKYGTVTANKFGRSLLSATDTDSLRSIINAASSEKDGSWNINISGEASTATVAKKLNKSFNLTVSDGTNSGTASSVDGSSNVVVKLPETIKATLAGNADTATKLKNYKSIDGINFDGTDNVTHYFTCSTDGNEPDKIIACDDFVLQTGSWIAIKFTENNTINNPKLKIGNTGIKSIYYNGNIFSDLKKDKVYLFVFNGKNYDLIGDVNTDKSVEQIITAANNTYPILFTNTANNNKTETASTRYGTDVKINPYTSTIYTNNINTNTVSTSKLSTSTLTADGINTKTTSADSLSASTLTASSISADTVSSFLIGNVSGNATSATKLKDYKSIDGINFNGIDNVKRYVKCSTVGNVNPKVINIEGFNLTSGALVAVKFDNTNTVSNPNLKINALDPYPIKYKNLSMSNLEAEKIYLLIFDNNQYNVIGDYETDTDIKVLQQIKNDNNTYSLLFTGTPSLSVDKTDVANFTYGIKVNPSQNIIYASKFNGDLAGNASSATKLKEPFTVKISDGTNSGVTSSVDGSSNVIVKLPETIKADLTGNADTATKLKESFTVKISDGINSGVTSNVNGEDKVTIMLPETIKANLTGNASSATKLKDYKLIDGINFDGTKNINRYVICDVTGDSTEKIITCDGFYLVKGAWIAIKFTETNTATNPVLKVNNYESKEIYYHGNEFNALKKDAIYFFLYNDEYFEILGDVNVNDAVTQNSIKENLAYPILLANVSADKNVNVTNGQVNFNSGIKVNPSTSTIYTNKLIANNISTTQIISSNISTEIFSSKNIFADSIDTTYSLTADTVFANNLFISKASIDTVTISDATIDKIAVDNMFATSSKINGAIIDNITVTSGKIDNIISNQLSTIQFFSEKIKTNEINAETISTNNLSTVTLSANSIKADTVSSFLIGNVSGNASSATKLKDYKLIDGINFNGTNNIYHYGECNSESTEKIKIVSCEGFNLTKGSWIIVKFNYTNTQNEPQLNVNDTGAKDIFYRGSNISKDFLVRNRTYSFIYNGSCYEFIGDLDTNSDDDIKVEQKKTDTNNTYPILFTSVPNLNNNITDMTRFSTGIKVNPSVNNVYASTFVGNLEGTASNAVNAANAMSDGEGNNIASTYVAKSSVVTGLQTSANNIIYTYGDGKQVIIPTQDKNVYQRHSSDNYEYPLLASATNINDVTNEIITTAIYDNDIKINPANSIIYAKTFTGDLQGVAERSRSDENGNDIINTYALKENAIHSLTADIDGNVDLLNAFGNSIGNFKIDAAIINKNIDMYVQQVASSENDTFPLLAAATANQTLNKTDSAIFGTNIKINPSTSTVYAATFKGDLTGIANKAIEDENGNNIQSTYAPLFSPVFTGEPKATTPTLTDTSGTRVATTGYVQNALTALSESIHGGTSTFYNLTEITTAINNKQDKNEALSSISQLETVSDRIIYTVAPNTYATTPLSAIARELLDDVNVDTMRNTLEVPSRTGVNASGTWDIDISGNANTASTLINKRKIKLLGAIEASGDFDGSSDAEIRIDNIDAAYISGNIDIDIPTNASSASMLKETRTFTISDYANQNVGTPIGFNGSSNITLPLPSRIVATEFVGLTSNAIKDSEGNNIYSTYAFKNNVIANLEVSNNVVTYTKGDGTQGTITIQDKGLNQEPSNSNSTYPLLASAVANATEPVTATAIFNQNIKINPANSIIYATEFNGSLSGLALKAKNDENGNDIINTYATKSTAIHKLIINDNGIIKYLNAYDHEIGNIDISNAVTADITDKKVEQKISNDNNTYPLLASATIDQVVDKIDTTIFSKNIKINPSTSTIYATTFKGNLAGTADNAIGDENGNNIASTYMPKTYMNSTTLYSSNWNYNNNLWYTTFTDSNIKDNHVVNVIVNKESRITTTQAHVLSINENNNGIITIFAENKPADNIFITYYVLTLQ